MPLARQPSSAAPTPGPERVLLARMLELVDSRSAWNRALWQLSSVYSVRECLEYDALVQSESSTIDGLLFVTAYTARQVDKDPGCGAPAARLRLKELLEKVNPKSGNSGPKGFQVGVTQSLEQMAQRVEAEYLKNWAAEIGSGSLSLASGSGTEVELAARSIVSHLQDEGFSGHHLHRWLKAIQGRCGDDDKRCQEAVVTFLDECHAALIKPPVKWNAIIPFRRLPDGVEKNSSYDYLSTEDLEAHCDAVGAPRLRRGAGAIRLEVLARDEHAAMSQVDSIVRRLTARGQVGGERIEAEGRALLKKEANWRKITTWQPQASLPAISRHDMIFSMLSQQSSADAARLDDALELLTVLDESTSWASVASAWAAVESLLAPGQRLGAVAAADRLADILACSYARAELTHVAFVWQHHGLDALAAKFKSGISSARKLDLLHEHLKNKGVPSEVLAADPVGAARVVALVRDPKPVLGRVREYLQASLRRLYDQRNRVMHAAASGSVALPSALRTTPTLVAAGLDRIVHGAHATPSLSPLALAARAENELSLLDTDAAKPSYDLL